VTTILSIQSSVAYGHVGNSAAVFPLMRRGIDVVPVYTVLFSNHPDYGALRGAALPGDQVADLVRGVDEQGFLAGVDAVLSGYLGTVAAGTAVLGAVERVRVANPGAVYCCDPVMGDEDGGLYVETGIPELMRTKLVPAAGVIAPNQFELNLLTGLPTDSIDQVVAAAEAARALGPRTVLVTSVAAPEEPDRLSMVAVTGDGAWSVSTPKFHRIFRGSGDLVTAIFLGSLLEGAQPAQAMADAAAVTYAVLQATEDAGSWELRLVAAQDEIAHPSVTFEPVRLR
jgi:pyridoxine kinase